MSTNVAILPQINLPAALLQQFEGLTGDSDLDAGVSAGFPVMSIRGAKWRIVEGGEEHPIYIPGTTDLAPSVKVVILRSNPAVSKTYYSGAYVEGTDTKPDCSSNDGVRPAPDSPNIQHDNCASCPQNVWGSKISPSGTKIKACADVRRIAILPADDLEYSPILLRIPGASLGDLAGYGKALKQRGIPYVAVVTKLSFDPDASYPKILFQYERVLTAEELTVVAQRISDPVVEDVLGLSAPRGAAPALAAPAQQFGIPADAKAPAQAAALEQAAAPAQTTPVVEPVVEAKPKATRRKGGFAGAADPAPVAEPAEKHVEQAAAPAAGGNMLDDINDALAKLNL